MRSSAIYNFVQVYLAPQERKKYLPKVSLAGRHYFLCPLPLTTNILSLENNSYSFGEQHLSIYAEHKDESPGLEAYHLTLNLRKNAVDFVLHCYFDQGGNASGIAMKQGDSPIELSDAAVEKINNYSLQNSDLILILNKLLMEKQNELQTAIKSKQDHAEKLSRQHAACLEKGDVSSIKNYMSSLSDVINSVKELNFISNNSLRDKQTILEKMVSAFEMRLSSHNKKSLIKVRKSDKTSLPTESPTKVILSELQENKLEDKETLANINIKLNSLKGDDLTTLKQHKKLLETKLKLIPFSDFENIIATLRKLHMLTDKIPEKMFELALQGNVEAANEIVEKHFFVILNFYFELIYQGQEQVFDILFKKTSMARLLRTAQRFLDDGSSHAFESFLGIAYHQRNENLFRKLLFVYQCNPDILHKDGQTIMHTIAAEGELKYAEMMFEAKADLNVIAEKPNEMAWIFALPKSNISKKKMATHFQQVHNEIKTQRTTPLMEAVRYSKDKMVKWLIEHKADVKIRGEIGLDAVGIHAARQGKPLHIPTLVALLQAGMSIDTINSIDETQCTPLHYACQWLDLDAVKILVNKFAADPNIIVRKKISNSNILLLDCLSVVITKANSPQTQEKALPILEFLLNQDIRPLIRQSLCTSIRIFQLNMPMVTTPLMAAMLKISNAALMTNNYDMFFQVTHQFIAHFPSELYQAILKNILKLDLIKAAEEDLEKKDFKNCIKACEIILLGKFNIEQYNERLWSAYHRAYLGLGDYEKTCWALEHYLNILLKKSSEVLAPKYKAEINKKIEKASMLLTEVQEKLLIESTRLPMQRFPMPFFAKFKEKQHEKTELTSSPQQDKSPSKPGKNHNL